MKVSTAIILSFTLLSTGCTLSPTKKSVQSGPGTTYAKWQNQVMDECSDVAAEVVLKLTSDKYKEGVLLTEDQIVMVHKYLVNKCSINSGLGI